MACAVSALNAYVVCAVMGVPLCMCVCVSVVFAVVCGEAIGFGFI